MHLNTLKEEFKPLNIKKLIESDSSPDKILSSILSENVGSVRKIIDTNHQFYGQQVTVVGEYDSYNWEVELPTGGTEVIEKSALSRPV